ncbi:MAG TPA: ATPase, T2SS/T4P/T4SS family [Polyangiaceae bacterium]|nr:ATPase, T2SS/T4P/T4SS family [Polyangiaceae bacterium]
MNIQVVVQTDDGQERSEVFQPSGPISIGRHPNCVLRLESDLVSRQHAIVEVRPTSLVVEDLSTNGTLAGDRLLRRESVEVPFGTPIVVGNFTIYLLSLDQAAPQPVGSAPMVGNYGPPPGALAANTTGKLPHVPVPGMPPAAMSTGALPVVTGALPATLGSSGAIPLATGSAPAMTGPPPPMQARGANGRAAASAGHKEVVAAAAHRDAVKKARDKDVLLRREIHKMLLEHLDLATIDAAKLEEPSMRPKVLNALRRIVQQLDVAGKVPAEADRDRLIGELSDEALGLGPLERFLADPTITEIMVIDPETIYVERSGKIELSETKFTDDERVRAVIERIVTPLGRRIDESSPLVDARLKDGSRVNAVIRPIALRGSCITIRKFSRTPLTLEKLMQFGALTDRMTRFLVRSVMAKRNIVISGGTGSGKTTLLNCLSGVIPSNERIVTIEDAAELQLKQPHVVSLETRPANLEGRGEYTIRDLVKNALRMRPDRIVVGECRGGEALDMLQAMNTGHDGSLTTTHANSPEEAIGRLETLVLMAGLDLPQRAIRDQIASSVHLIVQQSRLSDGSRKVTAITEITGIGDNGEIEMRPIFQFVRTGTGPGGKVIGDFRATGYLPSYLQDFIVMGLVKPGEPYL